QHGAMARIHGIALVSLILGGTALWLLLARSSGSAPEPEPEGRAPFRHEEPEKPGPNISGGRVEGEGGPAAKKSEPAAKPKPVPEPGSDAALPSNLVLRVRGIPGNVALPKYRWTAWAQGQRQSGSADEEGGDVGLRMPKGTGYRVLLEA